MFHVTEPWPSRKPQPMPDIIIPATTWPAERGATAKENLQTDDEHIKRWENANPLACTHTLTHTHTHKQTITKTTTSYK